MLNGPTQRETPLELSGRKSATPAPQVRSLSAVGLFSGIGGIELGLGAKHPACLICEIDRPARSVLAHHFEHVQLHADVRSLRSLPSGTQLIAGGFPCQDLSQAGRTAGIDGARSGLVGEALRLAKTHRVPWLLLENVPFMLQLAKGRALDVIVSALERLRYRWAYRVVNTLAFGLPQRRRRVILVASLDDDPRSVIFADDAGQPTQVDREEWMACGFYWTEGLRGVGWAVNAVPPLKGGSSVGVPSPPAIWLPNGRIVIPDIRDAERLQGFRANWTKPAESAGRRSLRWKLVGNAVSVPVAKWLGKRLATPAAHDADFAAEPVRADRSWPLNAWNVGDGRFTSPYVSEWPVRRPAANLHEFLRYEPTDLSPRATAGFLERSERATLHFPDGLLPALRRHLARVKPRP